MPPLTMARTSIVRLLPPFFAGGPAVPGDFVDDKSTPYEGYYFRILNAQGPGAPGGAKSYIEAGNMTGGFALIAWPAAFGHPVAVRTHLEG